MVEGDLLPGYLMMPVGAIVEVRIPASVFVSD